MNRYFKNLNKIEFVITDACTGKCKHCSEGDHAAHGEHIDPAIAADAVRKIAAEYNIKTVMTFGGEPLLYPDAVYRILRTAAELRIPKRQLITNGFFSKSPETMRTVAASLASCGVNDLLLSVDAFHQETIPLEAVRAFADAALSGGIPTRLSPAWLVSETDGNPYNEKTREILASFADLGVPTGEGNVIFPEGNALKFLGEYFKEKVPKNPYTQDPCQIKCISVEPDGSVLDGNLYKTDVMEIIKNYHP